MAQPLHHPPHVYLDDTWYIITGSTADRQRLFHPIGHKERVRDHFQGLTREFGLQLSAWVILDNHYHVLIKSKEGATLPRFIRRLHGRTAFDLNGLEKKRGRQVWHNYWDTCIRTERDYWKRFNYIHHNPIKHSYVQEIQDWSYSSYRYYLEHKGTEWLADTWAQYPIIDFSDPRDQF